MAYLLLMLGIVGLAIMGFATTMTYWRWYKGDLAPQENGLPRLVLTLWLGAAAGGAMIGIPALLMSSGWDEPPPPIWPAEVASAKHHIADTPGAEFKSTGVMFDFGQVESLGGYFFSPLVAEYQGKTQVLFPESSPPPSDDTISDMGTVMEDVYLNISRDDLPDLDLSKKYGEIPITLRGVLRWPVPAGLGRFRYMSREVSLTHQVVVVPYNELQQKYWHDRWKDGTPFIVLLAFFAGLVLTPICGYQLWQQRLAGEKVVPW